MEWRELRTGNRCISRFLHVLCHCPGHCSCLSFCVFYYYKHTFNVVEPTGHRRFSSVSLTMSTAKLVPSRSVGFRTYLAIVTGGFCTCLAIVPVSAAVFHVRMLRCTGQGVRSQRSKIGPKISQISRYIGRQIRWRFEIDRPKVLKEARRCRSVRKLLFPFAGARAKCGRNGPSLQIRGAIGVRQTPKVLRIRSSFGRVCGI